MFFNKSIFFSTDFELNLVHEDNNIIIIVSVRANIVLTIYQALFYTFCTIKLSSFSK